MQQLFTDTLGTNGPLGVLTTNASTGYATVIAICAVGVGAMYLIRLLRKGGKA